MAVVVVDGRVLLVGGSAALLPGRGAGLVGRELVVWMSPAVVVALDGGVFFVQQTHLLRLLDPALARQPRDHLVVVLAAPLLGALRIGGAIQHEGVHWTGDLAGHLGLVPSGL